LPNASAYSEAQGGTLFLDEVAELSARGPSSCGDSRREIRLANPSSALITRIVAATNRPLARSGQGRFRGDLRYRLDVIRVAIPPLRERLEDLPALVRHIWA
jgi:transcriptional regulator with PAS, ATPase and Fis domain